jgi:hypothetical protein
MQYDKFVNLNTEEWDSAHHDVHTIHNILWAWKQAGNTLTPGLFSLNGMAHRISCSVQTFIFLYFVCECMEFNLRNLNVDMM